MNTRTRFVGAEADEDLLRTLQALHLDATLRPADGGLALQLSGTALNISTIPTRSTSPARVRALVDTAAVGGDVAVVVADRVSAQLAEMLRAADVGWLDRRGHLRLVHGGVVIDTDVPSLVPRALTATTMPKEPWATPVGREVALELLVAPETGASVRGLARSLGRSPSAVSAVLRALEGQHLVDHRRRPRNPDLFWALAAAWRPRRFSLRGCPDPTDPDDDWSYELHADDLGVAGWALGDTRAAVAWGVPLVASGAYPPDLYVQDEGAMVQAMQHFGESAVVNSRACTVALAPAPAVCARRYRGRGPWPLVHPVVVALDLAVDAGRGTEALDAWEPRDIERVW